MTLSVLLSTILQRRDVFIKRLWIGFPSRCGLFLLFVMQNAHELFPFHYDFLHLFMPGIRVVEEQETLAFVPITFVLTHQIFAINLLLSLFI